MRGGFGNGVFLSRPVGRDPEMFLARAALPFSIN